LDRWISSITIAEISLVLAPLYGGNRKSVLIESAEQMFHIDFVDRCLPFQIQNDGKQYRASKPDANKG
jgi:hypothetical protein